MFAIRSTLFLRVNTCWRISRNPQYSWFYFRTENLWSLKTTTMQLGNYHL